MYESIHMDKIGLRIRVGMTKNKLFKLMAGEVYIKRVMDKMHKEKK